MTQNTTKSEIIMLGTGSAFPVHSYNCCFAIKTPELLWLADAGGGNGIFPALRRADIDIADLHHIFISHAHTDHILGVVWLMRAIINAYFEGRYNGTVNVYANSATASALVEICRLTFLKSHFELLQKLLVCVITDNTPAIKAGDTEIEFFDAGSENVAQTGFRMRLPSGKTVACLGDEALTEQNIHNATGSDLLMCGAFCRYADRDVFHPYEKHHLTVKDVAELAAKGNIGTLLLYHSEDRTPDKKAAYKAEASQFFRGEILIPADGDRFTI